MVKSEKDRGNTSVEFCRGAHGFPLPQCPIICELSLLGEALHTFF